MNRGDYIKLLIEAFGLVPHKIRSYKTKSFGGQYRISTGWEIVACDNSGVIVIDIVTPEGFNDAVKKIIHDASIRGFTVE